MRRSNGGETFKIPERAESSKNYESSFGKLILYPVFVETKGITLPITRKPQETQETRQDEGLKESPGPPESVF